MLMEILFSMVFFLLPVIGMFVAIIARGLREEQRQLEEGVRPHIHRSKVRPMLVSTLKDHPVMRYQLIESKEQMPLKFASHKRIFHQRAGP